MSGRYLGLLLPAFRLERMGFSADEPAALIGPERSAVRLQALTQAAVREGLRRGMTATEARALLPEIPLLPEDPVGEAEDRLALLQALLGISDRVASPRDDAVVLEIGRVSGAHGGEDRAALAAVALVTDLGHAVRAAVADDPRAALALAEWAAEPGSVVRVPPGGGAGPLAPLPLQSLRPSPELLEGLRAIGVDTLGRWAALDPASVVGRYGEEAARLHRVARGLPATERALAWGRVDDPRPAVWAPLPGVTSREELRFVLPGLVHELSERLGDRDLAAVRLRVVLRLEPRSGAPSGLAAVGIRIGRPTRSAPTLERVVRDRLEKLTVEAPIDEIGIEVEESVPEPGWQPGLADRSEATEPLPDLLARLSDQLGDGALFSPALADRWLPEAAWSPARFPVLPQLGAPARATDPVERLEAWELDRPLPRPTLLLARPPRIEVGLGGERPVRVQLDGAWRPITRASGPERLSGEWWEPGGGFEREYWAVEVDGRAAWIFCEQGAWCLHGWFD